MGNKNTGSEDYEALILERALAPRGPGYTSDGLESDTPPGTPKPPRRRRKPSHRLKLGVRWHKFAAWVAHHRLKAGFVGLVMLSLIATGVIFYINHHAEAELHAQLAGGKGVMFYSENDTTPVSRLKGTGSLTWGSEVQAPSSRNPSQVVVKKSPRMIGVWYAGIVDASGNLQVLRTTNSGTSWSDTSGGNVTWPVALGGTGTTQRFDMEFENNSGDLILAYSKNATTNEIATRVWTDSSAAWSTETTVDPGGTASVVTYIELANRPYSDELALGYVTNASSSNIGACIWGGSSLGNCTASSFGTCDQTAGTPDGADRCMDINYESASGRPVMSWGTTSAGDQISGSNLLRASRWNGSTWTTNNIDLATANEDDGTFVDCASNPDPDSDEIACGSYGASSADVQAWTVVNGTKGVGGANLDTSARAAAAGGYNVAVAYTLYGPYRRATLFYADVSSGATSRATSKLKRSFFSGTAWGAAGNSGINGDDAVQIKAYTNPYDASELDVLYLDDANDLNFGIYAMAGNNNPAVVAGGTGVAALEASVSVTTSPPFDMDFEPLQQNPTLKQTGYIWENDDEDQVGGDAVDENSQLAAGNTALSNIPKGERLTLRAQINATNGPLNYQSLSMFYDRNDGIWSRVNNSSTPLNTGSGTGCASSDFTCSVVYGNAGANRTIDQRTSMAIDYSGNPWIAFKRTGGGSNDLYVANYIGGTTGTCTDNTAWNCTAIDTGNDVGGAPDIAIAPDSSVYVSYYDNTSGNLMECTDSQMHDNFTCITVEATNDIGNQSSIAIDRYGNPWIASKDTSNKALRIARYVGASGTGCGGGSTAWTCTTVEDDGDCIGTEPDIIQGQSGQMIVVYENPTNTDCVSSYGNTRFATYVGTGGTGCTGGTSTDWTCADIDSNASQQPHLAIAPDGDIWVAEKLNSSSDARACRYSGGSWTCTNYWTSNSPGVDSSISIDPSGNPWIVSRESSNNDLMLARYIGGGGGSGCADSDWTCTTIVSTNAVGYYPTVVFDADGNSWISYVDGTNSFLDIAKVVRGGEVVMANGTAGNAGDPIQESHAEMSSTTDTTSRDDADCIGGSTWSNGIWSESQEISGLSVSGSDYCTEVAFTINTSRMTAGTTYRFIISYMDQSYSYSYVWRGLDSVSSGAYGTLTMANDTNDGVIYSKDASPKWTNCNLSSNWGCTDVMTAQSAAAESGSRALLFDDDGTAWYAFSAAGNNTLYAAHYVGSGGTGCADASWNCTAIDTTNYFGNRDQDTISGAIGPDGKPWFTYANDSGTGLVRAARYVGTGGTGCSGNSTVWTCWPVSNVMVNPSISFDKNGIPWIAGGDPFLGVGWVARYVGGNMGTDCVSAAWTCTQVIQGIGNENKYPGIVMNKDGVPTIEYGNNGDITLATFVGAGGTGCATTSYTCTTVLNDANNNIYSTLEMDDNGDMWIPYFDSTNGIMKYCKSTSGSFACTSLYTVGGSGANFNWPSIAIDPTGKPWMAFWATISSNMTLVVAQYVGGGTGTGCTSNNWTCTSIENSPGADLGYNPSIAFDSSGTPWVSYQKASTPTAHIAKMHMSPFKLIGNNYASTPRRRNARFNDARYSLNPGKSPYTNTDNHCGGGVSLNTGVCGLLVDDGNQDSVAAQANQRTVYTARAKLSSNSELPGLTWKGITGINPATRNMVTQVYRFGSTNAWETMKTYSTSGCTAATCTFSSQPTGTASEYFESSGGSYYVYFRFYQEADTSAYTLKTDFLGLYISSKRLRGGKNFIGDQLQPYRTVAP